MTRWLVIFICALIASDFAHGGESLCPHSNVVVYSKHRDDFDAACEAAGNAFAFFAEQGLDTTGRVEVHLVKRLPVPCLQASFGCYDHPNRRVNMLVFSECLNRRTWAGLPISRSLCKSLLTHEVAHAVAAANFSSPRPSILAHEYLAFVTMFSTMPMAQRERVLKRLPERGFESVDQMSTTFYLINPALFGADAYRHFLKVSNGRVFLKEVLSGRVLIDEGEP